MNGSFIFVNGLLLPGYFGAISVDIGEKKRKSVDIENCNYRQQIRKNADMIKGVGIRKKSIEAMSI